MAKQKRGWVGEAKIPERVGWAMREGSARLEREPWAAVVLVQMATEVGVAAVVHWLTERQEPGLRAWIEQARLDTFKRPEELALLNALLAPSGEKIDDDEERWAAYIRHVNRRNDFLHRGVVPSVAQARESEEACTWFQERLLKLGEKAARKLDEKIQAEIKAAARREALEAFTRGEDSAATGGDEDQRQP